MGKIARIARGLGEMIGRGTESILYGVKFKKVHLEVKSCGTTGTHPEHAWSRASRSYIQYTHNHPYYCEGVTNGP